MNFELRSFEDKINDITDQFMSLLESDKVTDTVTSDIKTDLNSFGSIVDVPETHNVFDNPVTNKINNDYLSIDFSKIIPTSTFDSEIPAHAFKFDSVVEDDFNKRLEDLYQVKQDTNQILFEEKPVIRFADSNINTGIPTNTFDISFSDKYDYTKDKIDFINDKEENNMDNYNGNDSENDFFSFATIPADKALTEKRTFADILFMDIPWDTKIDIWGGVKSLFNTTIKFTF